MFLKSMTDSELQSEKIVEPACEAKSFSLGGNTTVSRLVQPLNDELPR